MKQNPSSSQRSNVALRNIQAVVEDMRDNSRDVEKTSHFLHRNESRQYPAASTVCNPDKAKQSCVLEQRSRATSTAKGGTAWFTTPCAVLLPKMKQGMTRGVQSRCEEES
jgi:hypothetical protein